MRQVKAESILHKWLVGILSDSQTVVELAKIGYAFQAVVRATFGVARLTDVGTGEVWEVAI